MSKSVWRKWYWRTVMTALVLFLNTGTHWEQWHVAVLVKLIIVCRVCCTCLEYKSSFSTCRLTAIFACLVMMTFVSSASLEEKKRQVLKIKLSEVVVVGEVEGSGLTISFSSALDIQQAARNVFGKIQNKVLMDWLICSISIFITLWIVLIYRFAGLLSGQRTSKDLDVK